jgi:V8-like Glu-specific endopeptidase
METTGHSREAIVGGTATTGDPDVFMLSMQGNNGRSTMCSATLIAPRTLLTAAHCVDPSMLGATSVTITGSDVPTAAEIVPGFNTVRGIETRLHPAWNPAAGLGADLALVLLEAPQTTSPRGWNRESLTSLGGAAVRAVGYGAAEPDGGTGTKRTVDLEIRQLTADLISLGNFVDKGICHGDSGGPTFHTFDDGVERLVGVHSFTRTDDCLDGADTRVDAKASFILEWLGDKEDVCAADQVCSATRCPSPDPDCLPLGAACDGALQCPGRQCVNDVQHPAHYCSKSCSTDAECNGLSCDVGRNLCQLTQLPSSRPGEACIPGATFCTGPSVCSGESVEQARCLRPCTLSCSTGQGCHLGFNSMSVCVDDPITLPVARLELPAAPRSCSIGLGLWPVLAVLWVMRRRREA